MNLTHLFILLILYCQILYSNSHSCGKIINYDSSLEREERVVGGRDAFYGQVPWQALIIENKLGIISLQKCGGVLISHKWVLTAAHCEAGLFGSLQVVLGGYDMDLIANKQNKSILVNAIRTVVHPDFDYDSLSNDIALIELEHPVNYTDDILPVCLPEHNQDFSGRIGYVSGWGELSYHGSVPKVLQVVRLPILSNRECQIMFLKAGFLRRMTQTVVCAGYSDGGKDACEGDSGGPLTSKTDDDRWVLVGIVSNGIGCAEPNMPGIYTRVSFFVNWVRDVVDQKV